MSHRFGPNSGDVERLIEDLKGIANSRVDVRSMLKASLEMRALAVLMEQPAKPTVEGAVGSLAGGCSERLLAPDEGHPA